MNVPPSCDSQEKHFYPQKKIWNWTVNEDDIEEFIMGHEDELTTEELQEILNEEHLETHRNVSPSEQEEDERRPMPTSAIKDLFKKWADVTVIVFEWHPNQADVSRVGIFTTIMLLITSGKPSNQHWACSSAPLGKKMGSNCKTTIKTY
ncbi:uncharacterized protein TNCV_12001 [Trichonephila clavipes]|nr:uncharacterized protein TNCV_12001 [Trichonephila clavipes]